MPAMTPSLGSSLAALLPGVTLILRSLRPLVMPSSRLLVFDAAAFLLAASSSCFFFLYCDEQKEEAFVILERR